MSPHAEHQGAHITSTIPIPGSRQTARRGRPLHTMHLSSSTRKRVSSVDEPPRNDAMEVDERVPFTKKASAPQFPREIPSVERGSLSGNHASGKDGTNQAHTHDDAGEVAGEHENESGDGSEDNSNDGSEEEGKGEDEDEREDAEDVENVVQQQSEPREPKDQPDGDVLESRSPAPADDRPSPRSSDPEHPDDVLKFLRAFQAWSPVAPLPLTQVQASQRALADEIVARVGEEMDDAVPLYVTPKVKVEASVNVDSRLSLVKMASHTAPRKSTPVINSASTKRSFEIEEIAPPPKRARRSSPSRLPPSSNERPNSQTPGRTNVSLKKSSETFRRSSQFWWLDGNVVIHIGKVGFRLHRSTLARKSKYFEMLFERGNEPEAYYGGDPLYKVNGDSADFERLLEYIDDAHSTPRTFEGYAPVLRAAQRFRVKTAWEWASRKIRKLFPEHYDDIPDSPRPYAVRAVSLGEICRVDSILKPALYDLLRQPAFGFSNSGVKDNTTPFLGLRDHHVAQLIQARELMRTAWIDICGPSAFAADETAPSNKCRCAEIRGAAVATADDLATGEGASADDKNRVKGKGKASRPIVAGSKLEVWIKTIHAPPSADVESALRLRSESDVTVFDIGMLDVMKGIDILIEERWQNLECNNCLKTRRKSWRAKKELLWNKLDQPFHLVTELLED